MSYQDADNIKRAVAFLDDKHACFKIRPGVDAPPDKTHAYYAEETQSWWAITDAALSELGALLADCDGIPAEQGEVYNEWAEDDRTSLELTSKRPQEAR